MTGSDKPIDVPAVPPEAEDEFIAGQVLNAKVEEAAEAAREAEGLDETDLPVDVPTVPPEAEDEYVLGQVVNRAVDDAREAAGSDEA